MSCSFGIGRGGVIAPRNQLGAQSSKVCDPQIALQRFTRKIAFGNSKSGALALKGFVQIIRHTSAIIVNQIAAVAGRPLW